MSAAPSDSQLPSIPDGRLLRDARVLPVLSMFRRFQLAAAVVPVRIEADGIPAPSDDIAAAIAPYAPAITFPTIVGHHTVAHGLGGCVHHLAHLLPQEHILPKADRLRTAAVSLISAGERLIGAVFADTMEIAASTERTAPNGRSGAQRVFVGATPTPPPEVRTREYLLWEDIVAVVRDGAPPLRVSRRVRAALAEAEALIAHCRERFGEAVAEGHRVSDAFVDLNTHLDPNHDAIVTSRDVTDTNHSYTRARLDAGGSRRIAGVWLLGGPTSSAVDHIFAPLAWALVATAHPFKYSAASRWALRVTRHQDLEALNELYHPRCGGITRSLQAATAAPPPRRVWCDTPTNDAHRSHDDASAAPADVGGDDDGGAGGGGDGAGAATLTSPTASAEGVWRRYMTVTRAARATDGAVGGASAAAAATLSRGVPTGDGRSAADAAADTATVDADRSDAPTAPTPTSGGGATVDLAGSIPRAVEAAVRRLRLQHAARASSRFATEVTARLYHARSAAARANTVASRALLGHILSVDTPLASLDQIGGPSAATVAAGATASVRAGIAQHSPTDAFGRPLDSLAALAGPRDRVADGLLGSYLPRRYVIRPWASHGHMLPAALQSPQAAVPAGVGVGAAALDARTTAAPRRVGDVLRADGLCLLLQPDAAGVSARYVAVTGNLENDAPAYRGAVVNADGSIRGVGVGGGVFVPHDLADAAATTDIGGRSRVNNSDSPTYTTDPARSARAARSAGAVGSDPVADPAEEVAVAMYTASGAAYSTVATAGTHARGEASVRRTVVGLRAARDLRGVADDAAADAAAGATAELAENRVHAIHASAAGAATSSERTAAFDASDAETAATAAGYMPIGAADDVSLPRVERLYVAPTPSAPRYAPAARSPLAAALFGRERSGAGEAVSDWAAADAAAAAAMARLGTSPGYGGVATARGTAAATAATSVPAVDTLAPVHTSYLQDKRRRLGDAAVDPVRMDIIPPNNLSRGQFGNAHADYKRVDSRPIRPSEGTVPILPTPRPMREMGARRRKGLREDA